MLPNEEIDRIVKAQESAVRLKDIDGAMKHYSPDVVSFDVVSTLQKRGIKTCRERLESWLAQFPEPFSYHIETLSITADEEVAFCHSFNHVLGDLANGNRIDMRWRATTCFSRMNGKWLITHEHSSVPFDPETGMAIIKGDA
ncbi:YybH family protein [Arsenicibacter rosenii]|uniref:SnoaL-like domain-containing protein n=1 Tax=Arsenicibacter rosenii TaxID=1750698 RepID=A0A1S2VDH8_9BACT|nr:nuclear transport factor 2 family protein [Arsenicibacter rosenii]OIN56827.1 hypothetical protein BLX24_22915 [Arsenicibacter rosenii]